MHLHSSKGPINVVVLNQDEGLSSLIPSITTVEHHKTSSSQCDDDNTMQTNTSSELAIPTSVSTTKSSHILVGDQISETNTRIDTDSSPVIVPQTSSSGVVTRRMRRQAAQQEGEVVVVREKERVERRSLEMSGDDVGTPAVCVSVNDEEPMETDKVCVCVCVCVCFGGW